MNSEALDWFGLILESSFDVFAPFVSGGDDDARGEELLSEGGDERVDVAFGELVGGLIEFTLDADEFAGGFLFGDDVDTDVSGFPFARPFVEHPDIGKAFGVLRVEFKVAADQALKAVAKVSVVEGFFAKLC